MAEMDGSESDDAKHSARSAGGGGDTRDYERSPNISKHANDLVSTRFKVETNQDIDEDRFTVEPNQDIDEDALKQALQGAGGAGEVSAAGPWVPSCQTRELGVRTQRQANQRRKVISNVNANSTHSIL
jgi:hypothetical protein